MTNKILSNIFGNFVLGPSIPEVNVTGVVDRVAVRVLEVQGVLVLSVGVAYNTR